MISCIDPSFIKQLLSRHAAYTNSWPTRVIVHKFIKQALQVLFPHFAEKHYASLQEIEAGFERLSETLRAILEPCCEQLDASLDEVIEHFFRALPELTADLQLDAQAIYDGDPAARSLDEVMLAYPGFYAIAVYRIAHKFFSLRVPVFPRVLTEYAHQVTGIDIHPGASIASAFCIDHGTGIVIGETTSIGQHVKLYQGVTLGGLSVAKDKANTKRHPTIEDRVVIYAQATILGGDTVIGHNCIIGGNVWLTESVPPHSTVYHRPEIKIRSRANSIK